MQSFARSLELKGYSGCKLKPGVQGTTDLRVIPARTARDVDKAADLAKKKKELRD